MGLTTLADSTGDKGDELSYNGPSCLVSKQILLLVHNLAEMLHKATTAVMVTVCMWTQIRKDYYDENIKAGPQSRILEGVTWEEAQKIRV